MNSFVEVEFKGGRSDFFKNPLEFPFTIGDYALVEVDKGEHIGRIAFLGLRVKKINPDNIQYKVLRKANPEDLKTLSEIQLKEQEAMKICRQKVQTHLLPMKLVDVEYQFDLKKLTFYFTAEGRVDFRELVKDLAAHFRVRIELRQIGVRDETKRIGGYGVCGMPLCCTSFLNSFCPITTYMAKIQNLSLNPQKLSGTCGRLKCCLRYEFSYYFDELKRYPARESVYLTSKGEGVVEKIDIFTENVYLKYKNNEWDKIPLKDLEQCECIKSGTPLTMEGIETREEEIAAEAIESPWCQQNEINQDQNGLDEHPEAKKVPPGSD